MKFYNDKNKVTMVQTVASANTVISSVVGIIKKRILDAFPKNYFKMIYTDTSETFLERNKADLYNRSLKKIPYPSMTITPSLTIDDPVSGMSKNILMSSPNFWIPKDINRYYPMLLEDPDDKYKIYFSSDYITTNIRFKIVTNSFIQASNIGYWLKSRFADDTFKYLSNQIVQVEIPKSFINVIAKLENLFGKNGDSTTDAEDMAKLETLLVQLGRRSGRIRREICLNTGKQNFFFGEKENILTLFTDLDIPESVVRDNNVQGEYEINFRVQISAWHPNAFIMQVNKALYDNDIATDTVLRSSLTNSASESGDTFYSIAIADPIYLDRKETIRFSFTDDDGLDQYEIGQNILHETFNFSSDEGITHINLAPMLKPDLLKVHSYAVEHNMNTKQLLYILARSYSGNNTEVGTIDYKNLAIDFDDAIDTGIVIDIFINRALYDIIIDKMGDDDFYSQGNAKTTIEIAYYDGDSKVVNKVRVYNFENTKDMESTEINKSLRVKTSYGIGYVGLVMEGDKRASNYKICVGKTAAGTSIIRCLELAE